MVVLLLGGAVTASAIDRAVRPPATKVSGGGAWAVETSTTSDPIAALATSPPKPAQFTGPGLASDEDRGSAPNGTSRLWFAHGRWWAVLPHPSSGAHHIWALTGAQGPWTDTGVIVDERPFAAVEVAWTGDHLVVASTGSRSYESHGLRLTRLRWEPAAAAWARDADFPVVLTRSGAPGTQMAVTAEGRVWLARIEGDRVLVGSTDAAGQGFDGFAPLADGSGTEAGGVAVVADGDVVHLVWRSLVEDRLGEAVWGGGAWASRTTAVHGAQGAGSMDAVVAPGPGGGELLVAFTTSLAERGTNESDPSTLVVAMTSGGIRVSVASVNRDDLRYPQLVLDDAGGRIAVVATAPGETVTTPADGQAGTGLGRAVVVKWAEVDELSFGTGAGPVVLAHPTSSFAPPLVPTTSTGDDSGIVVMAAAEAAGEWATMQEGSPASGDLPAGRARTTMLVEDTFESGRVGGPAPATWRISADAERRASLVAGTGGSGRSLEVRTSEDGERVSACRSLPPSDGRLLVLRAVLRPAGRGTASARLLTLRGPNGNVVGAWLRPTGELEWLTPGGRSRTDRFVAAGEDLTITVTVDHGAALAAVTVAGSAGTGASTGAVRLAPEDARGPDEVCVAPAQGDPAAAVRVDGLSVETRG